MYGYLLVNFLKYLYVYPYIYTLIIFQGNGPTFIGEQIDTNNYLLTF